MDGLGLNKDQISFVIMFFAVGEIGGKILIAVVGHHYSIGILYIPFASSFLGTVALGVMTVAKTFPQMMTLSIRKFGSMPIRTYPVQLYLTVFSPTSTECKGLYTTL